jgi:hypothetical protein
VAATLAGDRGGDRRGGGGGGGVHAVPPAPDPGRAAGRAAGGGRRRGRRWCWRTCYQSGPALRGGGAGGDPGGLPGGGGAAFATRPSDALVGLCERVAAGERGAWGAGRRAEGPGEAAAPGLGDLLSMADVLRASTRRGRGGAGARGLGVPHRRGERAAGELAGGARSAACTARRTRGERRSGRRRRSGATAGRTWRGRWISTLRRWGCGDQVHILDELIERERSGHFDGLMAERCRRADLRFEIPNGLRADYVLEPRTWRRCEGRLTTLSVSAESGSQRVVDAGGGQAAGPGGEIERVCAEQAQRGRRGHAGALHDRAPRGDRGGDQRDPRSSR